VLQFGFRALSEGSKGPARQLCCAERCRSRARAFAMPVRQKWGSRGCVPRACRGLSARRLAWDAVHYQRGREGPPDSHIMCWSLRRPLYAVLVLMSHATSLSGATCCQLLAIHHQNRTVAAVVFWSINHIIDMVPRDLNWIPQCPLNCNIQAHAFPVVLLQNCVLLCFISPRVRKIRNEVSSRPGIFSRTLRFYYIASFPGSPLPHLLDGHIKLVGCSAIPARSRPGPIPYHWGSIVELELPPDETPGLMTPHHHNTNVLQSITYAKSHFHPTDPIRDKKTNAFETSMASPSRKHNFAVRVSQLLQTSRRVWALPPSLGAPTRNSHEIHCSNL